LAQAPSEAAHPCALLRSAEESFPTRRRRCLGAGARHCWTGNPDDRVGSSFDLNIEFVHYDPYGQALAKIERSHEQDRSDVRHLIDVPGRRPRHVAGPLAGVEAMTPDTTGVPGEELVLPDLRDLHEGRDSAEALLVAIGATRLRALGFEAPLGPSNPEHRLYEHLAQREGLNAHSAYNALVRRLVSFERAMEARRSATV
jgi:hypothetical protein